MASKTIVRFPALAAVFAWFALGALASAQNLTGLGVPSDGSATAEQLAAAISTVESRQDLDEEISASVLEQLREAESQLNRRVAAEAASAEYAAALESAPAETESLRAELDGEPEPAPTVETFSIGDDTELAELEQILTRENAGLAEITTRLAELEAKLESESGREAQARERISELQESRDALAAALASDPPIDEQRIVTEARRLAGELTRRAQIAEIASLEQETLSHSVRLGLTRAQRDLAARDKSKAERRVEFLRGQVNAKRQTTAVLAQQAAAAAAAELAAADKHPVVREQAEINAALSREMPAVAADIERVTSELQFVESEAANLEQRLAQSKQRLEVGGVSRAIGQLLIAEQRNLPQVSQYRGAVRERSKTLGNIGLAQVRIQEELRGLTPLDDYVDRLMEDVAVDVQSEEELQNIRSELTALLRDRRELLEQGDSTYRTYLRALGNLDVAQRRLLDSAGEFREFLEENLIWIPSAPIIGTGNWSDVGPAIGWALSPGRWVDSLSEFVDSLRENAPLAVLVITLLVLLFIARRPLTRRYRSINERVGRLSTDSIGLTLQALAIVAVYALPLPLAAAAAGWFLEHSPEQQPFSLALSRALYAVAPFLYNVLLFRNFAGKDGVGQIHFHWQEENLAIIRRQLDRLVLFGIPLVFATVIFYASDVAGDRGTMGRVAFVALMATLSLTLHPLAHPKTGVVAAFYERQPTAWGSKLRWVWYWLAVFGPAVLSLLSLLGYIYTSSILTGLLVDTIWLVLGLILVNLVVLRWSALTQRKIAWQLALKEREARKAEQNKEEDDEEEGEGELPAPESKPLDLDTVDLQTRKLLQSGLLLIAVVACWGIWVEVLPAFNLLQQVALWSQTVNIDGVDTIVPVTLADIMLGVVVAIVTVIAYRNLPGLMEIAVLQRLTLQPGSRYTINTLVRYVVVTVGTVAVLNIIGWNWSQIQWLVAALSVGLGFGLQEIVANFVSGLIILFERPVRVGDTVTVGQLTGSVSKVRIRATTITDWDRKEIIVPNKSFITEQVINWTLSDPITRVVVPVGISYGSDVDLAHRVMQETLSKLPLVLEEPEPQVFFMGFGDSSLNFNLYVYSRQLSDRLPLMHAVHESILGALRENNIEIPFPQRDLHIRSTVEAMGEMSAKKPKPD